MGELLERVMSSVTYFCARGNESWRTRVRDEKLDIPHKVIFMSEFQFCTEDGLQRMKCLRVPTSMRATFCLVAQYKLLMVILLVTLLFW